MRSRFRATAVGVAVILATAWRPANAQGVQRPGDVPRPDAMALTALVDAVAAGQPPGGDAWLKWDSHFLRAQDGKTYVPFTINIDEAPGAFAVVSMYVRFTRRGEQPQDRAGRIEGALNTRTGDLPVSVPERQFARGAPTAGEASARLSALARELSQTAYPFAGFYAAEPKKMDSVPAPAVRRALVVPPGDYDVYVAVRERQRVGGRSNPKSAVLKRSLSVPDFSRDELTTSSIIFADRIDAVGARLSAPQQAERPYALGGAEIVPAADTTYERHEALSLAFFVYNVGTDGSGTPDVTVQYRFSQMASPWKIFAETAPQRFGAGHIPPIFDAKAGRQLVVTQAVPLKTFAPGDYEIEIVVTDNVTGRSTRQRVSFRVGPV